MSKMIFVSLPVADLAASMAFYAELGFTRNPQFSDDTSACMVVSDTIFVMLMTHAKWATFTNKPIAEARGEIARITLNRPKQLNALSPTLMQELGAALLGGIAMLVFEKISSPAAWAAIDFPTISLLFGLATSTLLTVLVIPALYVWLRDDQRVSAR